MTRYEQGFLKKCASFGIDGRRLLKQAVTVGALAGAGLGAASGGLFGALASEKKNRLRNAILGAIAGGGIGFAGGSAVANGARADMMQRQLAKERKDSIVAQQNLKSQLVNEQKANTEAGERIKQLSALPNRKLEVERREKELANRLKLFDMDAEALRKVYGRDYASLDSHGLVRLKDKLPPDLYAKATAELDRRNKKVSRILNEVTKDYERLRQRRQKAEEQIRKLRPDRWELAPPSVKPRKGN